MSLSKHSCPSAPMLAPKNPSGHSHLAPVSVSMQTALAPQIGPSSHDAKQPPLCSQKSVIF